MTSAATGFLDADFGPEVLAPSPPSSRKSGSIAYYLAFTALVVNILDAWLFPRAGADSGGIKVGGLRVTDELSVLSLVASFAVLLASRLRVPAKLAIPLGLSLWVWLQGLAVGFAQGNSGRMIFGECHAIIYVAAVCLAWLQAPPELIRKHEAVFIPLMFMATVTLLTSSSTEKGGDLSTIAAGVAAIALVRSRFWVSLPLATAAFLLLVTGGQRAALLFSLPPLAVAVVVAITRRRPTRVGLLTASAFVAVVAGLLALYAANLQSFLTRVSLNTFDRVGKLQSADSRREQWSIATRHIRQSPGFGEGLGFQYKLYDPSTATSALTDITHNIFLDLPLRFGLVGSSVLGVVLAMGIVQIWAARRKLDATRVIAVLVLAGLLAKGTVESVLDKPRLMLFAAWLLATLLVATPRQGGHDE